MTIQGNQREIIVGIFDEKHHSLSVEYILEMLKQKYDYKSPGRILKDAVQEGILYVDSITDDSIVYLALDDWGETIWDDLHEE